MADEKQKIIYDVQVDTSKSTKSVNELGAGFDKLVPGVGKIQVAFKALIASPIGLMFAALAAAVGVFTAAIQKSEPILDFFEDIITGITATIDVLLLNLDKVGKILLNVLTFNFGAAADGVKELSGEISEAISLSLQWANVLRDLEDATFKFRIATADTENQIKALVIAAKNRNITFEEQEELLKEALRLERELVRVREDQARINAVAGISQIALTKGMKIGNETFKEFVDNLASSGKFNKEEMEKIVSLYEKQKQAASDSLAFEEKVANQLDAIADKRQDAIDKNLKAAEEARKFAEEINAGLEGTKATQQLAAEQARDQRLQVIRDGYQTELRLTTDFATSTAQVNKTLNTTIVKGKQEADKILVMSQLSTIQALGNLFGQFAAKSKVAAAAQALINTYLGVTQVLSAQAAPFVEPFASITRAIQVGVVLASGFNAIRNINSAPTPGFFHGGRVLSGKRITSSDGVPIYRSNGDNLLATVGIDEVILNKRQQAALGGAKTFARIGVPGFAGGGSSFQTASIANQLDSERLMLGVIQAVQRIPRTAVIIEQVTSLQNQQAEIVEQATI